MRRITLEELEADPEGIVMLAEAGETIVITRDGKDILQMLPSSPTREGGCPAA